MKMLNIQKRTLTIIALLLISIFTITNVAIAAEANLKSLDVTIKPEFDKEKTVFMMLRGEIDGSVSSSTKVDIYTPDTIIQDSTLHFCAIDSSGQHQCQYGDKTTEGNLFKFNTPMPQQTFQVEGYFESIKDNGGNKTLDYTLKAGQDIDKLSINIAEPKNSSNYKIEPSAQSKAKDDSGLINATYSFEKVKKGKEYNFKIAYTKKGWDIFFDRSTMGSSGTSKTGQGESAMSALTILAAVVGALALAGGALFAFSKMSQRSPGKRVTPVAPKGKARFCTKCGARVKGGAKFCPNCGAKTR